MALEGGILTESTGLRLFPLTEVTDKYPLPLDKALMIWHLPWKLKEARIGKIFLVIKMEPWGMQVARTSRL